MASALPTTPPTAARQGDERKKEKDRKKKGGTEEEEGRSKVTVPNELEVVIDATAGAPLRCGQTIRLTRASEVVEHHHALYRLDVADATASPHQR